MTVGVTAAPIPRVVIRISARTGVAKDRSCDVLAESSVE